MFGNFWRCWFFYLLLYRVSEIVLDRLNAATDPKSGPLPVREAAAKGAVCLLDTDPNNLRLALLLAMVNAAGRAVTLRLW